MEVELPDGCNIFYGNYIDNYRGSTRRRYYLNEGKLYLNTTTNNSSQPSNTTCMSQPLYYGTEYQAIYQFFAFCLIAFAGTVIWHLMIKKLWQGR